MKVFGDSSEGMKTLNCRKKPGLAKQLLGHDPTMVTRMVRLTFDIVKKYISDEENSIMGHFSVDRFANQRELLKALELFYEVDWRRARVMIMEVIANVANYDKRDIWSEPIRFQRDWDGDERANKITIDRFGDLFLRVIGDYPEYAVFTDYKLMRKACRMMGLNYDKVAKGLYMEEASKKLRKAIEKGEDKETFQVMAGRSFESGVYYVPVMEDHERGDRRVSGAKQIDWLCETFADKPEMTAALLLLKLK
jgi:hypothetical protein